MQKALNTDEERLRQIIDLVPHCIYARDEDGRFILVNRATADFFGLPVETVLGSHLRDIYPFREVADEVLEVDREIILSGNPVHIPDQKSFNGQGQLVIEQTTKIPYTISGSGKPAILGISLDVTEQKRSEEALKESEDWFRCVFNGSRDAVFISGENARFVDVNEAATALTGYSREELLGMTIPDLLDIGDFHAYNEFFRRIMSGESVTVEVKIRRKDDQKVDTESSNTRVIIMGKPYLHTVARDITERKKAEEEIKASLEEKKVLLSEIHHRVKNNMQVVSSLLTFQADRIHNDHYRSMFQESIDRIRSMALIHDMLYRTNDLARINSHDYLEELCNTLLNIYVTEPGRIEITVDINAIYLELDTAIPCGLIINELMTNALKHAFPGDRKGEIAITTRELQDSVIELSVSDNGIGMPEGFDWRKTGSLGLRIVRLLAEEQLNGRIECLTAGGTEFRVTFKQ